VSRPAWSVPRPAGAGLTPADVPVRLVVAALGLLAALLGFVAGRQPAMAIAAALGVAWMAITLSDLSIGVALFTVVVFFPTLGLAKAAGLLITLSWLATVVARRARPSLLKSRPGFAVALTLFIVWAALGLLWAKRTDLGREAVLTLILSSTLFPIVFAAVRDSRHVRRVWVAFVAGALLSGTVGYLLPGTAIPDSEGRLAGAGGVGPNQLGGYLAVAAILAVTLACDRRLPALGRTACAGAAALCLPLQLLTGSRGALLGLGTALIVAPFLAGRGRRAGVVVLAASTVLAGTAFFMTVAPTAIVEHLTNGDTSGSGRTDIWRMGWRMVEAHPVTGVGPGNFSVSTIDYLLRPGVTQRAIYIVDQPKVAHNIYLEVLAELGVVGLTLFGVIVVAGVRSALAAARASGRRGDRESELLSRGLLLALLAMLVAAFFSSELFSKQLWILLALAIAMQSFAGEGRLTERRAE
jgi:putative inorganic carbon (HCO3(-)) transporter